MQDLPLINRVATLHRVCRTMARAQVPEHTEGKEWRVQSYLEQHLRIWPQYGNHILAQYDEDSVVVYQAFCPAIADYAVRHQKYVVSCPDPL